jgi:hypothetical protein
MTCDLGPLTSRLLATIARAGKLVTFMHREEKQRGGKGKLSQLTGEWVGVEGPNKTTAKNSGSLPLYFLLIELQDIRKLD